MRPTAVRFAATKHVSEIQGWLRNVASTTHDRVRTHVLSRGLCDQSLHLLKPTLPEPGTCDIIDLNPGVCVWSEAVHDLLKPKRHVLVETRRELYDKYLDPLLTRPGSTYRYAPNIKVAIDRENGFLSPDTVDTAARTNREARSSPGRNIFENKSLLVIANLTQSAQSIPGFTGTEAKRFLNNFYRSLFTENRYIHQYGLVRLLAWIDDNARKGIIPTTIVSQTKQSLQLEAAFNIVPVASPSAYIHSARHFHRWHQLDIENLEALQQAEDNAGIVIPKNRRPKPPQRPLQTYPPNTEFLSKNRALFPHSQRFIEDLLSVEAKLAADDPQWLHRFTQHQEKGVLGPGRANHILPNQNPDHILYRRLLNQLQTYHNNFAKVTDKIAHHRSLWYQLRKAQGSTGPGHQEKYASLCAEYEAFNTEIKALKSDNRILIYKAIDDYRAYDSSPPTMTWNHRAFEPLVVQADEFYPHRPLSLIDMSPRPQLLERLHTADKQICFDYVLTTLSSYKGDNVVQAAQRLVGEGYADFLSQMPELQDISKGGWYDLENLRVRSLGWPFLLRFAELFDEWPYREPTERLIAMGSSVFDKRL